MNAHKNHGRLSDVVHVGHLLGNAAQTSRTHVSCADRRLKLHRMTARRSYRYSLSLVLRTIVLTLAIISSFLDVDGRPETGSVSTEVLAYLLIPWCRVLLEQLTGLQLVKKFPAFHGTRRFITALTSVRHLSLSWASPIQSIYPHPTSWRSILILSTHLRLGLPSGLFPSGFPTKTLHTPPLLTHTRHMPSPFHSSRFYHPHNIG